MSRDQIKSRRSKFPFLANQRPSAGSPSSSSTLNPSSAISIADSPSYTHSPRFTNNGPPSSHDPFIDIFSMDLAASELPSSSIQYKIRLVNSINSYRYSLRYS
ncbi:hypothetical protein PGTUg99_030656 [Puccinia graminis f. sp. tritici]|uniref:Uncharacterized protein n=1 Tax=Puccinia graminis f. sp. tritici TaxID=56615 RepID=A0A5B0LUB2_PUCGR|nr:hypothetical protein PGTUg99_030656 [Puccinia graminis f. sp. tritici]